MKDEYLIGTWESTEAFGNTALDWSEDVKKGIVSLRLSFRDDGQCIFEIVNHTGSQTTYKHILPPESSYEIEEGDRLKMHGDKSGLQWNYQREVDEDGLRIRLVGAKRFGRCKGVDVIYMKRIKPDE